MTTRAITDALKARLGTLTFSPAIPIAWPNRDYTPDGSRFLTAAFVRAPHERLTIGGGGRESGSLVVTVATLGDVGTGEGEGIADAVAAHFPADLRLSITGGGVRITAKPSIRDAYQDAGYWRTPVVIPFEAIAS